MSNAAMSERARWWLDGLAVIKAGAADTNGQLTVVEVTEPPNAEAPLHVHHREDEAFYVLEGERDDPRRRRGRRRGAPRRSRLRPARRPAPLHRRPGRLPHALHLHAGRVRGPRHPDELTSREPHAPARVDRGTRLGARRLRRRRQPAARCSAEERCFRLVVHTTSTEGECSERQRPRPPSLREAASGACRSCCAGATESSPPGSDTPVGRTTTRPTGTILVTPRRSRSSSTPSASPTGRSSSSSFRSTTPARAKIGRATTWAPSYRSAIFYTSEEQRTTSPRTPSPMPNASGLWPGKVVKRGRTRGCPVRGSRRQNTRTTGSGTRTATRAISHGRAGSCHTARPRPDSTLRTSGVVVGYTSHPLVLARDPPPSTVQIAGRAFTLGSTNVAQAALTAQAHDLVDRSVLGGPARAHRAAPGARRGAARGPHGGVP